MARIVRTPQAQADLLDIWRHIAETKKAPDSADHVLREIDRVVQMLAQQPMSGSSAEQFRPGLRLFPKWNYLVFYQPLDDGICVIRILHGAQQYDDLL